MSYISTKICLVELKFLEQYFLLILSGIDSGIKINAKTRIITRIIILVFNMQHLCQKCLLKITVLHLARKFLF